MLFPHAYKDRAQSLSCAAAMQYPACVFLSMISDRKLIPMQLKKITLLLGAFLTSLSFAQAPATPATPAPGAMPPAMVRPPAVTAPAPMAPAPMAPKAMNPPPMAAPSMAPPAMTAPSAAPASTAAPAASMPKGKAPMAMAAGAGPDKVWLNAKSKTYHCPGSKHYGKTKEGAYMSEADAKAKGGHAVKNKACGI
jgi:hypothetical protein